MLPSILLFTDYIFITLNIIFAEKMLFIAIHCHWHNNAKFYLPLANTNLFKRDIVYQGPKLWNSIPANIRNKVSVPTFKTALIKHLLSNNQKQYTF